MPAKTFPWGSNPFPLPVFFFSMFFAGVVSWALLSASPTSAPGLASGMSLETVRLPVLASLAWVLVYGNGLGAQVWIKLDYGNFSPDAAKLAERTALNMLEQAPLFFVTMWLHCAYVDAAEAGFLGLAYTVFRMLYQLFYSYFGTFTVLVEFATQPSCAAKALPLQTGAHTCPHTRWHARPLLCDIRRYSIIYYFIFSVLGACYGMPLASYLPTGLLQIPIISVANLLLFNLAWKLPSGGLSAKLNNAANPVPKQKE